MCASFTVCEIYVSHDHCTYTILYVHFGHQAIKRNTSHHHKNTTPTLKHGCCSTMRCSFSLTVSWKLVRIQRMVVNTERFFRENLIQFSRDLRLVWRFPFQQDNDPILLKQNSSGLSGNV